VRPAPFAIVWRYKVKKPKAKKFEAAYGPGGDWAKLFQEADGYLWTELLGADDGQYVTIDYWRSEEDFHAFKEKSATAYAELDAACEALTASEEQIGQFGVRALPS
jgi:heme-degrading monooxygenase HmoA